MSTENVKRPWLVFAFVVTIAFLGGATISWLQLERDPSRVEGLLWPDPPRVAPVNLVDARSEPFTLDRMEGRWSLLFFGFTSCPDVCPTTLDALARAHDELRAHRRYGEDGQVVFVSVDPDRDTPELIERYVEYFHEDFLGVTASVAELETLTRSVGALFMKVPQPGADDADSSYTVDHSAGVFFVDPQLRLVSVITPPHSAAAIVQRFEAISGFVEANP